MHDLKRASQLEIKKGGTAVEREVARLCANPAKTSRPPAAGSGRRSQGEAKLESAAIKAKRAMLAEENKADFWLEGRPLSDIKAEAVIAHNNLLVSNEFPSAALYARVQPGPIYVLATAAQAAKEEHSFAAMANQSLVSCQFDAVFLVKKYC